jgi:hypothetical protein
MDMLYRAYSSPLDLIKIYINQGRFGTFVEEFIKIETEKIKEEREKDTDNKLWLAYNLNNLVAALVGEGGRNETFVDWKQRIMGKTEGNTATGGDADLDDEGIKGIIGHLFSNNQSLRQGGE